MLISKKGAHSTVQSISLINYLYPYFEKNKKERGNDFLFHLNTYHPKKKG